MRRTRTLCAAFAVTLLAPFASAALERSGPGRHDVPLRLPAPTGRHVVGTSLLRLVDARRGGRELSVQVWYPVRHTSAGNASAYIPDPAVLAAMKRESYLDLSSDTLEQWRAIRTSALWDVPIAAGSRFPLLVFSPGFGMSRSNYTALLEELASHGYVLAAIDHPGTGFTVLRDGSLATFVLDPSGDPEVKNASRAIEMATDVSFVIDALLDRRSGAGRFASHIDRERIGCFGHSLGGAAAIQACASDPRVRACADLDGDLWGTMRALSLGRDVLIMLNEPGEAHRPPPAMREARDREWAEFAAQSRATTLVVKVAGTFHFSFSDIPFLVPKAVLEKNGATVEATRGHRSITETLRAFFARRLGLGGAPSLARVVERYPELEVSLTRQPR